MSFPTHQNIARLSILAGMLLCACSPSPTQDVSATVTARPVEITPTPAGSRIRTRISLPNGVRLAFGDGSIWISNPAERSISRIDMNTGQPSGSSLKLDIEPREIAYGEGAVWVCSADRSRLIRIDPQMNEVTAEIDLRGLQIPEHVLLIIAAGEGAVWLTDQTSVIQIDPQTDQIVGERLPAGEEVIVTGLGQDSFWTGSHDDGIVSRVEAATHRVTARFDVGFSIHGLVVSEDSLWVLDEHGFGVVRIDPQTNEAGARVPIDFVGSNLAAGGGSVWVAPAARDSGRSTGNDGIARIDERTNQIVETIHVGSADISEYYSVYFSEGSLWVIIEGPQTALVQIEPAPFSMP